MEISVIIPSYNDGALLARCLDSLVPQRLAVDWEVVVALDGSRDGSRELLARGRGQSASGPLDSCVEHGAWRGLPLQVVELERNGGRSAARNAALARARGEWLLFLDADLRVGPDWAARLRAAQAGPEVVAVGEMVYEPRPDLPLDPALLEADPLAEACRRAALKPYQRYLETRGPWKFRDQPRMPARYFYTCNSSVHRSLLERAGPFDERLIGWGGEDIDMGLRLEGAGGWLAPCPGARALHAQERPFAAHCANLERLGREGLGLLVRRHPGLLRDLQLDRLLPAAALGRPRRLLTLAWRLGLHRRLLRLEALGLPMGERLYDLVVFLHYAGGFRETQGSGAVTGATSRTFIQDGQQRSRHDDGD